MVFNFTILLMLILLYFSCIRMDKDNNYESKRGKNKLLHEGFLFTFDKLSKDHSKKFWRCELKNICKARLHTTNDNVIINEVNQHCHGNDAAKNQISKIVANIKRKATSTSEVPSVILNDVLKDTSVAILGKMPNKDAIRKVVQRCRNEENAPPPQPTDRASIVIPENYKEYEYEPNEREQFLLWDSGEGDVNRILIFGRKSNGDWSNQMDKLYVDGTFSIAPALFSQIYIIMAERSGFVLPVLYVLLPNKTGETYLRMWPLLNPSAVSIDFEKGAITAVQTIFPNCQIHGCLFHLTKNMRKQLAEINLLSRYMTEPDFAMYPRMVVALTFVPISDLNTALETLEEEIPDELRPVINWFEDNYLGRRFRYHTRRPVCYPPATWSVYERTLNGEDRTNNHVEAAHRRLQTELGMSHPTLWKFIGGIRTVQKGRDHVYEQFVRGDQPPTKRTKYVQADARIKTIVESYNERNILEYLRGISHNFIME